MASLNCTDTSAKQASVSFLQQASYALPTIPVYFLVGPLAVVHGIYAKHFGLSLSTIAAVLLACRLFDAVSDPAIGYYSDRYHLHQGSRKPFIIMGGLLLVISSYFLFVPDGANVSAAYFLVCLLAWYFAFTLFEIPQLSWAAELMPDSQGKTVLYGLRNLGVNIGLLLFYIVPLLPGLPSTAYTPQTLQWVVIAAGLLMLPSLWLCHRLTPNGGQTSVEVVAKPRQTLAGNLQSLPSEIINNKPLLVFLAAFFSFGIGLGMWVSLQFIFIDAYLGLGEHFAKVNIIGLCVGSILIPFWAKLSNVFGKKMTWGISVLIYILSIGVASTLQPGEADDIALIKMMVLYYGSFAAIGVLVPSLLADIIDYSTWKFGENRAATYFSLQTFSIKTTAAVGSALGLGIAGWYGFDASADSHSHMQVFGLQLAAFWLPIPILLITLIFIALIPMDNRRHKIIRRRLDARLLRVRTSSSAQTISPLPSKFIAVSD